METTPRLTLKANKSKFPKVKITDPTSATSFIRGLWGSDMGLIESCFILLLNHANETIGYAKISQGGVSSTIIDPKVVAFYAVKHLASAVIMAHNHPSGNTKPSHADIALTKRIKDGLSILDITLWDHIILTEDSFCSSGDEGYI